jgi:galactokinase
MHDVLPAGAGSRDASIRRHRSAFHARFGNAAGVRLFFSPGRVNLMGAHLDYNGGPVMPMAIDRGTFCAARPRTDRVLRMASTLEDGGVELDLDALPERAVGAWFDYPVGVLRSLLVDGRAPCGLDVLFGGDLPIGAGLSSSASICVGTAFVADRMWDLGRSVEGWVAAALWGEREFVGVRCGIMDPYAVGFARPDHLLWLDCKDASTSLLPLDAKEVVIAVADTGIRRELAQVAFNERVAECGRALTQLRAGHPEATCLRDVPAAAVEAARGALGPRLYRRARHVAEEVERTFAAREALLRGDLDAFGAAITAAHASLRDLYEVSVEELDVLVAAAASWPGVLGTRLTGAGFGGCTVILLRRASCAGMAEHVAARYRARFGRDPRIELFGGDPGPREHHP